MLRDTLHYFLKPKTYFLYVVVLESVSESLNLSMSNSSHKMGNIENLVNMWTVHRFVSRE